MELIAKLLALFKTQKPDSPAKTFNVKDALATVQLAAVIALAEAVVKILGAVDAVDFSGLSIGGLSIGDAVEQGVAVAIAAAILGVQRWLSDHSKPST